MAVIEGARKWPPTEEDKDNILSNEKIYSRIVSKFNDWIWKSTGGNGYYCNPVAEDEDITIYLWDTGFWSLRIGFEEVARGKDESQLYSIIIKNKALKIFNN